MSLVKVELYNVQLLVPRVTFSASPLELELFHLTSGAAVLPREDTTRTVIKNFALVRCMRL